jgi:hypothetical protein
VRIQFAFAICFCASIAWAGDSATTLARILEAKGAISATEFEQVQAASPDGRVAVLAALLEHKGLITSSEAAVVRENLSQVAFVPAVYTGAPPAAPIAPAPQQPAPQAKAEAGAVTAASKFPVTVYGTLLLSSFFNTSRTNLQDVPLFAQPPNPLGDDKNFGMTTRQTRFGLRYQGGQIHGAKLGGTLELDLFGGKAAFGNGINMDMVRLRLAYGTLDWKHVSLTGGQDWSIFAPLNPTSLAEFAIPEFSTSGNPWIRMPQIRVDLHNASTSPTQVKLQLAAIDPDIGDFSTTAFTSGRIPGAGERGRAPGFESRLEVKAKATDPDHNFTFGASTHYTHGKNSITAGVQLPFDSWGIAGDYLLKFDKHFNLMGEVYAGRALGIFSVTSGFPIEAPPGPGDGGVLARGGWAQAQFNFTPQWQTNFGYGAELPKASDLRKGDRVRNQTFMWNLIYKYSPHVTFAWELRRLRTDYRNAPTPTDNERGFHINMARAYVF